MPLYDWITYECLPGVHKSPTLGSGQASPAASKANIYINGTSTAEHTRWIEMANKSVNELAVALQGFPDRPSLATQAAIKSVRYPLLRA